MNGILGLNVLGDRQFDRAVLLSFVQRLKPAYTVCMNNPGLAAALTAHTRVIVRRTPDDNAQDFIGGAEFVQTRAAEAPKGTYLYLTNEPTASKKLNDWTLDALKHADQIGVKCCILNLSTGNPEPSDWDTLAPCIQYAVAHGHLVGVHEYFDRDAMKDYPYHIGRYISARQRFGGNWVVTELGCAVGFDPYKGWLTALSEQEYAFQLDGIAGIYAGLDTGACIFSYPEWDGHGFDVSQAVNVLHPQLIRTNAKYPIQEQPPVPTTPPTGNPIPMRVTAPAGLNLRSAPDTSASLIRTMPLNERVVGYPDAPQQADGYTWIQVKDALSNAGWATNRYLAPISTPPVFRLKNPVGCATVISSHFGVQRDYGTHEGIDITRAHPDCTPLILNGADGVVMDVSSVGAYGNHVIVSSVVGGQEYRCWYCHMAQMFVSKGQVVKMGDPVGVMGSTGNSTGVHLHLSVQKMGAPTPQGSPLASVIDPENLIDF